MHPADSIACQRTSQALPWFVTGQLGAPESRQVREHLLHCSDCRQRLLLDRQLLAAARKRQSEPAPAEPLTRGQGLFRLLTTAAALVALLLTGSALLVEDRASHPSGTQTAERTTERPEVVFVDNFESGDLSGWQTARR